MIISIPPIFTCYILPVTDMAYFMNERPSVWLCAVGSYLMTSFKLICNTKKCIDEVEIIDNIKV